MSAMLASSVGTSFGYLNGSNLLSNKSSSKNTLNVPFRGRNGPKAVLHAVIDEPMVATKNTKERSLYDILNVTRNASHSEIKSAYRSLAKRYHPDTRGLQGHDDGFEFIDIHNAYVTLSDPTTRALYDLKIRRGIAWGLGGVYAAAGRSSEFYTGRRWETDQCW